MGTWGPNLPEPHHNATIYNTPVIRTTPPSHYNIVTPPPKKQRLSLPPSYSVGELGKFALRSAMQLAQLGWPSFFNLYQQSSIHPNIHTSTHPHTPTLHQFAPLGVPAPTNAHQWTLAQKDSAVSRCPHPSTAPHHTDFMVQNHTYHARCGY